MSSDGSAATEFTLLARNDDNKNDSGDNAVSTGDTSHPYLWMSVFAASSAAILVLLWFGKEKKHRKNIKR